MLILQTPRIPLPALSATPGPPGLERELVLELARELVLELAREPVLGLAPKPDR